ncbi:ATP-binding protein [Tumebacillus flagellatus]|uniref:ATP-binding protein n=1 Tax=Tumebacillus flagellatus TaxID=1157490 RepID=UPI001EE667BE|nr:ATP-binding protein [Tumebacillus flagellatus]
MLNNLLLNLFVNLFFVTIYFSVRVREKHRPLLILGLASASLLLCLTFPVSNISGYRFGLGMIPVLVAILYGRAWVSLVLMALMVAYRLYLGGGSVMQLYATVPAILTAFACKRRYQMFEKLDRLVVASALPGIAALGSCAVVWAQDMLTAQMTWFLAVYALLYLMTAFMCTLLIETLRENRAMRLEMQRMEKLRVLGDLAAAIAHEVRHPMTVAGGFLQLLREEKNPADKRHYIDIALQEMKRGEEIIAEYLAFANPEIQKPERVQAAERTRHVLNGLSSLANLQKIEIVHTLQAGLWVTVDAGMLDQVLLHVIRNGMEAMPQGGRLHVSVTKVRQYAEIQIEDTGVGMTLDEVARLGNPFYTTKDKGTGLGLMVAYRYVEVMRGKIRVQSEKGRGTRFLIQIPISG